MASLRKRYSPENGKDGPTAAMPQESAAQPPPVADDKDVPTEPMRIEEPGPVKEAERKAIGDELKRRLSEVENAEKLVRQQQAQPREAEPQPQQPITAEQIIAGSGLPERAKNWLRQHPEFILDAAKNNTIIALHDVAKRQSGEEWTDRYFERMEDLLGLTPRPEQVRPAANQPIQPRYVEAAPARTPVPQQARPAAPVSAPPTRDAPSMTTGRSPSEPLRLTAEEQQLARTLGLSDSQYMEGKKRMMAEKAAGMHDGR